MIQEDEIGVLSLQIFQALSSKKLYVTIPSLEKIF